MKENVQSLFNGSKHFPSFLLSRMNAGRAIGVLLLAVIAIALSLSNPQRTSSALVTNTENAALPQPTESPTPACETVPLENCVIDANGNPVCCSINADTGDRTCPFKKTSCEAFDNPCDPDNPVFALVTTTLLVHSHTDTKGHLHFHTHLEIHGKGITLAEFDQCKATTGGVTTANNGITGKGFAFVKASTSQTGDIITLVKDSSFTSGPPPETFSDPLNFLIITLGPNTLNFRVHSTLHFTANANGEMSACVSHESTSCPQTSN